MSFATTYLSSPHRPNIGSAWDSPLFLLWICRLFLYIFFFLRKELITAETNSRNAYDNQSVNTRIIGI